MQMCPKKYEEVFQQLNQYDVFVVSTDKNTVKKTCVTAERLGNLMS